MCQTHHSFIGDTVTPTQIQRLQLTAVVANSLKQTIEK